MALWPGYIVGWAGYRLDHAPHPIHRPHRFCSVLCGGDVECLARRVQGRVGSHPFIGPGQRIFFIGPAFSLAANLEELTLIATFVLVATLINSLTRGRRRAEAALVERDKQLRLIIDATPALISYVGPDLRYRFNNRTYETWFGTTAANISGRPVREVLGEATYEVLRPHFETVLAGQPASFEQFIPYQTGGLRYVQATYIPDFDEQSQVRGFVVLVNDISERKQAEESEHRARQVAEETAKRIASLQEVTVKLSKALTPAEIIQIIFGDGLATIGASGSVLALLTAKQDEFEIADSIGYSAETIAPWRRFPVKAGMPWPM